MTLTKKRQMQRRRITTHRHRWLTRYQLRVLPLVDGQRTGSLPESWIAPQSLHELRELVRYRHELPRLQWLEIGVAPSSISGGVPTPGPTTPTMRSGHATVALRAMRHPMALVTPGFVALPRPTSHSLPT